MLIQHLFMVHTGQAYSSILVLFDMYIYTFIGTPPDIDEGLFMPQPPTVPPGDIEVKIGSPAYVVNGSDVTIVCDILSGTHPITISWLCNGEPDPTRSNVSTITVTDYNDGEEFTCRADNDIGFDEKSSTINVFGK